MKSGMKENPQLLLYMECVETKTELNRLRKHRSSDYICSFMGKDGCSIRLNY
jgi:hypothetical protein